MAMYRQHGARRLIVLVFASFSLASSASRADSLYELLPGKQYKLGQLGFQSKWQAQWFQRNAHYLTGYWDTSLPRNSYLSPQLPYNFNAASQDIGVSAVLRYQRNDGTGFYAEAGTGPQYQSYSFDWAGRPQGNRLALNTSAGGGFVWKNGVDLGFKASYSTRGQGMDGGDAMGAIGIGLSYRW